MNLKKTVLALAIAGITAAPMMASAEGSLYGSIRYGIQSEDTGGVANRQTTAQDMGSRYGIKGETDLGNGMSAFGHWEEGMIPRAVGSTRELKVGVKGDFGQLYIGEAINGAWDSYMSTDGTWWYGGTRKLEDGIQKGVTYMGAAGPASFGVTIAMDNNGATDDDALDAIEAAVAFDAGPVNIALAMHDAKADADAVTGLVLKGSAGGLGYALDFQSQGDASSMQVEGSFGSFYGQFGSSDDGSANAATPTALVLGYYQSIGPNTGAYYEMVNADADDGTDAVSTIAAVLMYSVK